MILHKLHRHDREVCFNHLDHEKMRNIGCCNTSELSKVNSNLLKLYPENLFMSLNGFDNNYLYDKKALHNGTGLKYATRQKQRIEYLNANFIDLDIGRENTDGMEQALSTINFMESFGKIPPISMKIYSGQGLWLLWLLGSKDCSVKATKGNQDKWNQIQRALINAVENSDLEADSNAKDLCRICRVPNSLNPKANKTVIWEELSNAYYGIDELLNYFPANKEQFPIIRKAQFKGSCPNRAKGPKEKARRRRDDLLKLSKKFPIKKGKRLHFLRYLARFCETSNMNKSGIARIVKSAAKKCIPSYPSDSSDMSVKDILKACEKNEDGIRLNVSNRFLFNVFFKPHVKSLKQAYAISEELQLESIRQGKLKKQSEKKNTVKERRDLIKQTFDAGHKNLKHLQMALKWNGISISQRTLQRDLQLLKITLRE